MTSPWRADSPVAAEVVASPNHGERRNGRRADMLLLHYTGMPTAGDALRRLCDPTSEVSSHYFVFEDGRSVQLVPETRRAWHAGAGSWADDDDINSCSIGIEIANPGHDGGLPPFPEAQVSGVIALAKDIVARCAIAADRVLAHSDVAPGRKQDPGERFPWGRLHSAGVGHWVEPAPIRNGRALARGECGSEVETAQTLLARYGYRLPVSGVYDERTEAVVGAFQRHFRPERVDGIADESTLATLRKLIASQARSDA